MKRIISVILALLMLSSACALTASAATTKTVKGGFNYDYAKTVYASINAQRKKIKAKALVYDKALTDAAMKRAAELSVYYSHTRPNKANCSTAFKWTKEFGENIAMGQKTPAAVMKTWMNSAGHKKNILRKTYTRVGIGCYYNQYGELFWVQAFSGGKSSGACKTTGIKFVDVKVSLNKKTATTYSYVKNVPAIKTVKAKVNKFTYDGKNHKPVIVITDTKGKTVNKQFYQISYPSAIKDVGDYYVYVREIYRNKQFKVKICVLPQTPQITSVTPSEYGFSIKWKKVSGEYIFYELQYATDKSFKNSETFPTNNPEYEVGWLNEDTTYYVRVRAYTFGYSGEVYSAWSKVQTVKTNAID